MNNQFQNKLRIFKAMYLLVWVINQNGNIHITTQIYEVFCATGKTPIADVFIGNFAISLLHQLLTRKNKCKGHLIFYEKFTYFALCGDRTRTSRFKNVCDCVTEVENIIIRIKYVMFLVGTRMRANCTPLQWRGDLETATVIQPVQQVPAIIIDKPRTGSVTVNLKQVTLFRNSE